MARFGIHLGADLRARDMAYLQAHFGSAATCLYNAARGVDNRQVTRRRSCDRYIRSVEGMLELAQGLLSSLLPLERGVRLLGVSLSGLWRAEERLPAVAEPLPETHQRAFDFLSGAGR